MALFKVVFRKQVKSKNKAISIYSDKMTYLTIKIPVLSAKVVSSCLIALKKLFTVSYYVSVQYVSSMLLLFR